MMSSSPSSSLSSPHASSSPRPQLNRLDCDRALELGLEEPEVFFLRGVALHSLGKLERAIADFDRVLELGVSPEEAERVRRVRKAARAQLQGG